MTAILQSAGLTIYIGDDTFECSEQEASQLPRFRLVLEGLSPVGPLRWLVNSFPAAVKDGSLTMVIGPDVDFANEDLSSILWTLRGLTKLEISREAVNVDVLLERPTRGVGSDGPVFPNLQHLVVDTRSFTDPNALSMLQAQYGTLLPLPFKGLTLHLHGLPKDKLAVVKQMVGEGCLVCDECNVSSQLFDEDDLSKVPVFVGLIIMSN